MITAMIPIRHANDQNIHRLRQDRAIIIAGTIIVGHRPRVDIKNHRADAAQAVAVIVAAIPGIQTDRVNIQDVNAHRVDQARAATNMTSTRTKGTICVVIATNMVAIELISFMATKFISSLPKKEFCIKFKSNVESVLTKMNMWQWNV